MANKYPTIFIHGLFGWGSGEKLYAKLPYWGASKDKELTHFLTGKGYEVYNPSVGPVLSAWDRSCELWAFLMGGTVDYGKVHSEKYHHARYGRTYEKGAIEDWGMPGNHKKINIVGHSFGGPTVKQFAELVAHGCQEEIDATPEEELSGLFKANKPQKLHTVTTLSGVNNGTTYASKDGKLGMVAICNFLLFFNVLFSRTKANQWWDFHTDHFGIMPEPSTVKGFKLTNPFSKRQEVHNFAWNDFDCIARELQVETQCDINETEKVDSSVYYFARRACRSNPAPFGTTYLDHDGELLCKILCPITAIATARPGLKKYGVDKSWKPNDGIVNVIGQSAPLNAPQTDYNPGMDVTPGIWYNMPVERKDHMSWAGIGEDTAVYTKYYEDMVKWFSELPDGEDASDK